MAGVTSNPRVTIQLQESALVDAFEDRRDLIVGQLGVDATATSGDLIENVENTTVYTDADLRTTFGADELYHRIVAWRTANGGYSPLNVIGLDADGGATAATSSIQLIGAATGDGTLTVSAVDGRKFSVDIPVESGDSIDDIGQSIEDAFAALENYPPFVSSNASGLVSFAADDVGTAGNFYGLKLSGNVAGVSATLTGWSGGATDPSVTSIFDPIDGLRYTGINWPEHWGGDITTVTDLLDGRFNVSNDILDGMAFCGHSDTYANLRTFVSTLNSQSLVVMGNNKIDESTQEGPAILSVPSWDSAYFQGVRARRLTPDAPISDFIVAQGGPLDTYGGPSLASLPYFNTPMNLTQVTRPTYLFSNLDQASLESDGVSTYGVNSAVNTMISGVMVTTRTTDAAANENDSFHFLNFVDTSSACREIFFKNLKATFAQSRLTEGDVIEGYSMANEDTIKAELLRIYRVLANAALVQAGSAAEAYFAANTSVSVSLADRSATITSLLPIVSQLGEINYTLTLSFSIESTGTQTTF